MWRHKNQGSYFYYFKFPEGKDFEIKLKRESNSTVLMSRGSTTNALFAHFPENKGRIKKNEDSNLIASESASLFKPYTLIRFPI